jgi:hypothetical protein
METILKGTKVNPETFREEVRKRLPKCDRPIEEDISPVEEDRVQEHKPMNYSFNKPDKPNNSEVHKMSQIWKRVDKKYSEVEKMLIREQLRNWEFAFKNVMYVPRNIIMNFCVKIGMYEKRTQAEKKYLVDSLKEICNYDEVIRQEY